MIEVRETIPQVQNQMFVFRSFLEFKQSQWSLKAKQTILWPTCTLWYEKGSQADTLEYNEPEF